MSVRSRPTDEAPQESRRGAAVRAIQVTHVITDLDIGGAELMLARLVRHLDATRVSSRVISLTGRGPVAAEIEQAGVPVMTMGTRRGIGVVSLFRLSRLLRYD